MSFKSSRRGVPAIRARREAALGAVSYPVKVLGYGPIAYWPLWESAGATAQCLVNSAQNGTYTGVTLANGTAPDGSPCPFFDGANDFVRIYSAALQSVYSMNEFTMAIWCRVNGVGVWTDGIVRRVIYLRDADNNRRMGLRRNGINNQFDCERFDGAVFKSPDATGLSTTDWFIAIITCSVIADELKFYINTTQYGGTQNGLAAYGGNTLSQTQTLIGAATTVPAEPWHGWLAHAMLFDRVLSDAERISIATG